ncbi:MAG: S41 family peptidase [Planctomycetota bacterium]|nr:S41 family peptidase [Planctomycetota bacterium]
MARWMFAGLILLALALSLGSPGQADAADKGERGYYRQPALHGNTVVFVAEGDLWSVSATGGTAKRLTSHPDTRVAFTARYEGPREIYVMPIEGGRPTRLTYGAGRVRTVSWRGKSLLYSTRRYAGLPDMQLVALDVDSGHEQRWPLSQADEGILTDADRTLYFTRLPFQGSHCKRYQGGSAQQLWRLDAKNDAEAVPLTADHPGTSKSPMLLDGRLYHLSDRDGTMNLWSIACTGKPEPMQHTYHKFFDIKEASMHGDRVAYRIGADIRVFNLTTVEETTLDIRLQTDADQTRRKWIHKPMDFLTAAHPSPDGSHVALTARGRVFVAPAGPGRLVALDPQGSARQRDARFSHDGKHVRYFSDASDEVELWERPADGSGTPKQLTKDGSALRTDHLASPDGRFVAHADLLRGLYLLDTKDGSSRTLEARGHHGVAPGAWSADGRWFVYWVELKDANDHGILRLFDTKDGTTTNLTTTRYGSHSAVFGSQGAWLYFLSERHLDSIARSPWGSRQPEPHYDQQTRLYALALKPGLRAPFQEPDELSRAAAKAKAEAKKAEAARKKRDEAAKKDAPKKGDTKKVAEAKGDKPKVKPVEIVREGIAARLYLLPVPPGRYDSLAATKGHLLWRASPDPLKKAKGGGRRFDLQALKLGTEKAEVKTRLADVGPIEVTQDGKKLLLRKGSSLHVVAADSVAPLDAKALAKGAVPLGGWRFAVDPRVEWAQMYDDAWRMHRDYFYDPGMHGVDWARMREAYRPLVKRVRDRDELQDLTGMLVSELSALHASVWGGDTRKGPDRVEVGELGADLVRTPTAGGYFVNRIHAHDPDRPELAGPLSRPDLDIQEGDVIVAIDHRPALPSREIGQHLVDGVGKQVHLTIRRKGREKDLEAIVKPIGSRAAARLRYPAWEYARRQRVEEAGTGRFGYIHLQAMGAGDMAAFVRQFYPVFEREGIILDVRHNRGGNVDAWILARLMRKAWMYWQARSGTPYSNLRFAPRGHMVVLCDEHTASDGEAFAEGFRRLGLGAVIGTRTWGGEIWLHSGNRLADKGVASAGMFGVFGPKKDGTGMEWLVEGHGVEPDLVVDNPPVETFLGKDRQLDAAMDHLRAKLAAEPKPLPKPPPYPDKSAPNNARK